MRRLGGVKVGIGFFLIGLAVGLATREIWVFLSAATPNLPREVRSGNYRLTNPLLECDTGESSLTSELKPFKGA